MTFADQMALVVENARSAEQMDTACRQIWSAHFAKQLTDEQAQRFAERIHARQTEMRQRVSGGPQQVGSFVASIFPKVKISPRSPNRSASIERRRRLAASGPLPPQLAQRFTTGEQAVLRIIGDSVNRHGYCALHIDAIAAMAGVCRRLVQHAIRLAENDGLITVTERRLKGRKNDTNVIRIIVREWLAWLKRGPRTTPMAAPSTSGGGLKALASEGIGCRKNHPTNTRGYSSYPSVQGRTVAGGLPKGSGRAERWFASGDPRAS